MHEQLPGSVAAYPSAPEFYGQLSRFGASTALITREGSLTYEAMDRNARQIASNIGEVRRLIFLEAVNTREAICTYLACLIGRHPVLLFSPQDDAKISMLAGSYRPNRVFRAVNGSLQVTEGHDEPISLHPDLRILLSTSGSTGSPKLVKLSRQNISANALSIVQYLRLDESERALLSLKFNYSYGMSVVNSHLFCGASLILTDTSVLDDEHWALFREFEATSFAGVPYTFEALFRSADRRFETPSLRYVTQAGGRLSPELVRHFATLGKQSGWRFYVMYGQTEASPRISYLPPEHALQYPNCIGIAIPGGRIFLRDTKGREITTVDDPGELAYAGPNVMMGYAHNADDLFSDETPPFLLTGDIACRNSAGLFYITGRSNRFVKPFGIRINLDDVEARMKELAPQAACTGLDERIIVAVPNEECSSLLGAQIQGLAATYGLPPSALQLLEVPEIPRLPTGKIDYPALAEIARQAQKPASPSTLKRIKQALTIITSVEYARQIGSELGQMLGLTDPAEDGIAEIYSSLLTARPITSESTFTELAGDSLSYVQASVAIEQYLGELPDNWERMTISDLEQRRIADA